MALPIDTECDHCGFIHHKAGGSLKWYMGAMQCPKYVELLLEEMDDWGRTPRAPMQADETVVLGNVCKAPDDFICYHKGSLDGVRKACLSPDGFSTQVLSEDKTLLVKLPMTKFDFHLPPGEADHRWIINESRKCPHMHKAPRSSIKRGKKPFHPKAGHAKGHYEGRGNPMPGRNDWRKQRVFSELQRRVDHLLGKGERVTPESIAKLGGFTERREDDAA